MKYDKFKKTEIKLLLSYILPTGLECSLIPILLSSVMMRVEVSFFSNYFFV